MNKILLKSILSCAVVLLFVSNKYICDFFYTDLTEWWTLRLNLYAVLFGLVLIISTMDGKSTFISFVLSIGVGFSISDIVDRLYFNINVFQPNDIIMIFLTVIISYITYYVRRK